MDRSSSCSSAASQQHNNWLAFSLSNDSATTPHPHFSLFQALNSTHSGGLEEDASGTADMSILAGGSPKLEDFLGGDSGVETSGTCQFPGVSCANSISDTGIYDSDLKTIAASFLGGNSGAQGDSGEQLAVLAAEETPAKKVVDTFGQRTSIYRGVTRHRWTGRYEAHLWDNSCRREGQSRKGRQVYLGGYDKEDKAARAYDLAALKYWGPAATTNFPVCNYEKELEEMKNMTRQEFVASLRRKSSGFSRGASMYRGVTRHHQHGRWQARIGRVAGNKDLYLGTFSTQEEAAEAYDIAAIKFRGLNAVTNFDMSRYDVNSIASSNLPIGGFASKSKTPSSDRSLAVVEDASRSDEQDNSSSAVAFSSRPASPTIGLAVPLKQLPPCPNYWSLLGYQNPAVLPSRPDVTTNEPGSTLGLECHPTSGATFSVNETGYLSGGGFLHQQNSGTSSLVPSATPLSINGNSGTYGGSGFGNWVEPAIRSYQPAKPNLLFFQTPIFGME